ncbi:MAG: DUF4293 domain-containing protein [Bacteroidales bacterium]|nr:DUF4293 domain-containing protein [Bacteroidales bacterium]
MIQRIQSLFLLIASGLMGVLVFSPIAFILDSKGMFYEFYARGLIFSNMEMVMPSIPLLAMVVVISLLLFISIFLYKNRMLQMRICIFSMLLIVGMHGLYLYHSSQIRKHLEIVSYNYKITMLFPIISIILIYMALRAIRKDDKLVRSYDRIR